jgi:membrane-bound inhibitor of C-type lysozyme
MQGTIRRGVTGREASGKAMVPRALVPPGSELQSITGETIMLNKNEFARDSALIGQVALLALLLNGCVGPGVQETVLPARIDYVCANNRVLPVARGADGRQAAVRVDGKEYLLQRAGSAAQEKYGDGRYALYLDGERAMLEQDGRVLFGPCTSPVPLPSTTRYR